MPFRNTIVVQPSSFQHQHQHQRYDMIQPRVYQRQRQRCRGSSSLPVMVIWLLLVCNCVVGAVGGKDDGVVVVDGHDLDGLNALLKNVELSFPDYEEIDAGKILLAHLFVNVEHMKCHNLHVSDLQLHNSAEADILQFSMDGFDIDCNLGWHYKYWIKHGSGDANVKSRGNTVSSGLRFTNNNQSNHNNNTKPTIPSQRKFATYNVTKEHCDASFSIDSMHFEGGFADLEGGVVSLFKSVVEKKVQSEVQNIVCQQLQKNKVFQSILQTFESKALTLIQQPHRDVLHPEQLLSNISHTLMDLKHLPNYPLGYWIQNAVDKFRDYATSNIYDPLIDGKDLGINQLLRRYVLTKHNETGRDYHLNIPVSKLTNGFIYSGKELFNTITTVKLDNLEIYGLDSISTINPLLQPVGQFTVANSILLQNLTSRMDFTVHMTPPNNTEQVEHISITWGVQDVNLTAHTLLAIDQNKWSSLTLNHLLQEEYVLHCLSTVFHTAQMTGLNLQISPNHVRQPKLTGFVSKSLDQLLTNATHFALDLYQQDMGMALPNFFDYYIRTILNKILKSKTKSLTCPILPNNPNIHPNDFTTATATARQLTTMDDEKKSHKKDEFLNFYDLLLPKERAKELGGLGTAPYGNLFSTIQSLLEKTLHLPSNNSLSAIRILNDLIVGPMTKRQSNITGELSYPGMLVNQNMGLSIGGLSANLQVSLSNVSIQHLNTIGQPLKLASPTGPHQLTSATTFGVHQDLETKITFYIKVWGNDPKKALEDKVDISLKVSDLSLLMSAMLKVSTYQFERLSLSQFLNGYCWAALIPAPKLDQHGLVTQPSSNYPTARISDLSLNFSSIQLHLDCKECTSPGFQQLSKNLNTDQGQISFGYTANHTMQQFMKLMEGKVSQVVIDRVLNEAHRRCLNPHQADPQFKAFNVPVKDPYPTVLVSIIGFGVFLLLSLWVWKGCLVGRARRRMDQRMQNALEEELSRRWQWDHREKAYQHMLNTTTRPMFLSSPVPLLLRISVPFIVIGNIFLFLTGHLSLGASVAIHAGLGGQSTVTNHFYEFSMFRSAVQMWTSGAKILSVLTVAFSGVWPYSKQIVTFFLWFAPATLVSVKRRGLIYDWLDLYSKWSLVDIFVTMMSIVGFRTSIHSPTDVPFLPKKFYYLDLLVIPRWGIYANMIAIVISQITSHYMVYYHRKVVSHASSSLTTTHQQRKHPHDLENTENNDPEKEFALTHDNENNTNNNANGSSPLEADIDTNLIISPSNSDDCLLPPPKNDMNDDTVEVLHQHVFVYDGYQRLQKFKIHQSVNVIVMMFAVLVLMLHLIGCCVPIFDLETVGLVGVAVDLGNDGMPRQITQYSVVSMIQALFGQVLYLKTFTSFLGMTSLILILITAIITLPLLVVLLWKRWFRPLSEKQRVKLDFTIEMMHAWQLVEVFLFSIMVTAWQLGPVSQFFLNDYCDSLDSTLSSLAFFGFLQDKDAQCLRIQGTLNSYTWFLFFASVTFAVFNHIVTTAAKQQETDAKLYDNVHSPTDHYFTEDGDSFADDLEDHHWMDDYRQTNTKTTTTTSTTQLNFVDWYRYILCLEDVSETTYELIDNNNNNNNNEFHNQNIPTE